MAMIDLLKDSELDMIERYIDAYATVGKRVVNAKYILREWSAQKELLAPIFGQNLILSKEVRFKRSEDELRADMNEAVCWGGGRQFIDAFNEICYQKRRSTNFLTSDLGYQMESLTFIDALMSNVYEGATFSIQEPDWEKPIKIQHGARITRILGKLAEAYHLEHFEEFRVAHGQALNQKETHGTLCLSIHPLDYMTMSDNSNGWSSCMNWQSEGCYRQGTVEMMNSPCVIVAYLAAADNMPMPGKYTWNNKKWRELYIVNPAMISNIKSYPYHNDSLTQLVMEWLKELTAACDFGSYDTDIMCYYPWRDCSVNNRIINIDPCTGFMYNDFSDEREQFGIFDSKIVGTPDDGQHHFGYTINYSGLSECMACGALDIDIDEEVSLMGNCCYEYYECEHCGDRYYDRDEMTEVDDELLCSYCVEHNCDEDSLYRELHRCSNMVSVYLACKNKIFHDAVIQVYHEDFDNPNVMKRYFDKVYRSYDNFNSYQTIFVKAEECTAEGLEVFGYNSFEELEADMFEGECEYIPEEEPVLEPDFYTLRSRWSWRNGNEKLLTYLPYNN